MKKKFGSLLLILLCWNYLAAQGISFRTEAWNEILSEAKQQNKVVFVDMYTSWCGPCKVMERDVFSQPEVGKYYNENFICYKLDAEKGEGIDLVEEYGVTGYPTYLFVNGDGQLLYNFSGVRTTKEFIAEAHKVNLSAEFGGLEKMKTESLAGTDDYKLLKVYYELCPSNEKEKVLRSYMMALPDSLLFVQETRELFDEGLATYNYPLMKRLIEGRVKMGKQSSDFDFLFTFPLQLKMSNLFNDFIQQGDSKVFDQLMQLKKTFSVLPSSFDGDINLSTGRGLYFMSEDFLNLYFLKNARNDDEQYVLLMEKYMDELKSAYPLDAIAKQRKVLEERANIGGFFADNLFKGHSLFGKHLTNFIDYYWRLVPSTNQYCDRCVDWLEYACNLNPYNPHFPIGAASLFVRCKQEDKAIQYLEKTLNNREGLGGQSYWVDEMKNSFDKDNRLLHDALRDVKNQKI